MEPTVIIAVPRRDDNGWRDDLWRHCRSYWESKFPWWDIYQGYHYADEGPFNRSIGVNRAVRFGSEQDWDVALIIDSDVIPDDVAVAAAVDVANKTGAATLSHTARLMLNQKATTAWLNNDIDKTSIKNRHLENIFYDSVSCCLAIPRQLWDLTGGFDERFRGWGYEDSAFAIACETIQQHPVLRVESELVHLWHPVETGNSMTGPKTPEAAKLMQDNSKLLHEYKLAHMKIDRLKEVIECTNL